MLSRRSLGLALLGTALVAGCSTTRVVDSQVQSWSTLTTPSAPPTYRPRCNAPGCSATTHSPA